MSQTPLFTWVDYLMLVVTVVLSLGIGLYQALTGDRQNTTDEYLLGNRKMKIIPVAVSMTVSYVSAISLMGFPAEIYYYGATFWFMIFGGVCGTILGAVFYVPLLYPLRLTSINEYLDQRYESALVVLVGWFSSILVQVVYIGIVLYAPAVMVETMTGFPMWGSMLLLGLAGTIYTTIGGLKAVVWTDFFQAAVILGGLLAIVIKGTSKTGGIGEVWSEFHRGGRAFVDFSPSLFHRQTVWSTTIPNILAYTLMFAAIQTAVQRFSAVPTLQAAKRTVLLTLVPYIVIQNLCCLSGVVAFSYFARQGCEPLSAGLISGPNGIIPFFVIKVLNYPGLPGLFCASILCGSLSNLSSSLSAVTALTWSDLMSIKLSHLSERKKTMFTKIMTAGFGLISIGFGLFVSRFGGTLYQMTILVISGIAAPTMTLFIFGPLIPRINWKSALVGTLVSMCLCWYLGFGSLWLGTHQEVLPGDISKCKRGLLNITDNNSTLTPEISFLSTTITTVENMNSNATSDTSAGQTADKGWKIMFDISPYWIGPLSTLLGMVAALLASLLPGCHTAGKRTPHLYLHCIRSSSEKDNRKDEYHTVETRKGSTSINGKMSEVSL